MATRVEDQISGDPRARGLPPIPPPLSWTKAQVGKREAKAAEREAKAVAKAARRAARKRDPRLLDLEEAIAASTGDAEKDAPQD
jgi:hypothetical protein